ncbi:hypothetical protein [Burkholderia anthina]|uniref:hypothetical protein n=1 Tax=Burkholderia anthina TaxID=179879 RepID=UPI0015896C3B|nr:hypothetical protein [Burkholderia anthina]
MTTSTQRIPASTVLSIELKDHTPAACKLVLFALRDYGFRTMRHTKRGGVITAVVRYCASDMAEALGELAKILPVDPAIQVEPFILS